MDSAKARRPAADMARKIFFAPIIAGFLIGSLPVLLPTMLYRAVFRARS